MGLSFDYLNSLNKYGMAGNVASLVLNYTNMAFATATPLPCFPCPTPIQTIKDFINAMRMRLIRTIPPARAHRYGDWLAWYGEVGGIRL